MADLHQRSYDPVGARLQELAGAGGLHVVDVGGGSGTRAVPLALMGNAVTVVDPSIDALATLRRRAAEAGVPDGVQGVQADTEALGGAVRDGVADLMLCHHVLEEVEDPQRALTAIAAGLRPGGVLSLLVTGRNAAVVTLAIAGRFTDAAAVAEDPRGTFGAADPLRHRFDTASVSALLDAAGLEQLGITGIGVLSGVVPGSVVQADPLGAQRLADLERSLSEQPPLCEIATDLHVLARRPTG